MSSDRDTDIYTLGWVSILLMDYAGRLKTGFVKLYLWPRERANPIGPCISNPNTREAAALFLRFDSYPLPVFYPTEVYADTSIGTREESGREEGK